MSFWRSVLASVVANIPMYVPIVAGLCLLWHRYAATLKVWDLSLFAFQSASFELVLSARDDQPGHYRPSSSETEAMVDLLGFLNNPMLKWLLHLYTGRPQLSEKVTSELINRGNLVLLGGPLHNSVSKKQFERLARHGLPYTFRRDGNGEWVIWDCSTSRFCESTYLRGEQEGERNYVDHGLLIHAPHEKTGQHVFIFAGNHGQGTRAAVTFAVHPHLCRQIIRRKKAQGVGRFYVALIRVEVNDFVPSEPVLEEVRSIGATPSAPIDLIVSSSQETALQVTPIENVAE